MILNRHKWRVWKKFKMSFPKQIIEIWISLSQTGLCFSGPSSSRQTSAYTYKGLKVSDQKDFPKMLWQCQSNLLKLLESFPRWESLAGGEILWFVLTGCGNQNKHPQHRRKLPGWHQTFSSGFKILTSPMTSNLLSKFLLLNLYGSKNGFEIELRIFHVIVPIKGPTHTHKKDHTRGLNH